MEFWRTFWTVACTVGLGSFFILVLVIIPRGARELKELFVALETETDRLQEPPPG